MGCHWFLMIRRLLVGVVSAYRWLHIARFPRYLKFLAFMKYINDYVK
jgi:hypothetical protein